MSEVYPETPAGAPPEAAPWAPGDRVTISLPDKSAPYGRHVLVPGTVREVDPPGLPRGVRVDLDWTVNGVQDCFAAHGELRRLEVSHDQ